MITLPHNPPVSYFIDGMDLGTAVDAITGDVAQSALDPSFTKEDVESSGASDTFYFRTIDDMTEFQSSQAFDLSNSITLPAEGLKVGAKSVFDFSSSSKSSGPTVLIVLDWERRGTAKRVGSDVKLNDAAKKALSDDKASFRKMFGDFFVYQLLFMAKFTAVWKCTAETTLSMNSFKTDISGSLNTGEVEGSGSFTSKLSSATSSHKISVEVQYQVVGDAGDTQYDKGDVIKTLNSFREVVKPVPYEALLRHYSTIEGTIPITIDMEFEVYERVSKVFTLARFVLFLIGLVPGMSTVRIERKQRITALFSEIYANRIAYESDPSALKSSLEKLGAFHQELWVRLQRQELLTEICSITFEDMKSKLTVDFNNPRGSWVRSSEGVGTYVLGRTAFSGEEIMKYGIKVARDVAEVKAEGGLFKGTQTGFLRFPGGIGIRGYVVGLTIEDCWKDGTNGWWCLGNGLSLGRLEADVEVMAEDMKGMHWKLHVHYIPSAEYDK